MRGIRYGVCGEYKKNSTKRLYVLGRIRKGSRGFVCNCKPVGNGESKTKIKNNEVD